MLLLLLVSSIGVSLAAPLTCPGGYKNGDKIKEGQFVKKCTVTENGYSINVIGCLTTKGTEVLIGSKVEENKVVFNCTSTDGGGAKMETVPAGTSVSNGQKDNIKCDGKYTNGQKFNDELFVKQCNSSTFGWAIQVIGCLTPSKKEIALGGNLEEGPLVYSCIKTEDGGAKIESGPVKSTGPKENIKCADKYSNGQKFNEGFFVKECKSTPTTYVISVIACLTPSGTKIIIGGKAEEDKMIYSCVQTEKGVKMESDLAVKGCEDGKYHKGQTYLSSNKRFLLKCVDDYGSNDIVACMTDDGKEVKTGSELVQGMLKYKCVKESNGSVRYLKEPFGTKDVPKKGCGEYKIGDDIFSADKKFKFTCVADGKTAFSACVVEGGKEVKADTTKTIGEYVYDCKSTPKGGATLSKKRIA